MPAAAASPPASESKHAWPCRRTPASLSGMCKYSNQPAAYNRHTIGQYRGEFRDSLRHGQGTIQRPRQESQRSGLRSSQR